MFARPFQDRADAGRRLAAALRHLSGSDPLVLALPRGGVPVAWEVAKALDADLDLLFVRKIGAPGHEEYAIGAVVDGAEPQLVLNEEAMRVLSPEPAYVRSQMRHQLEEIERRRRLYVGDRPPLSMTGRTIIIVDDGIATGATIKAGIRGARKNHPARLVLAVPVAPREVVEDLRRICDELVCLEKPNPFHAVGAHYADFRQTEDREVEAILDEAGTRRRNEPA